MTRNNLIERPLGPLENFYRSRTASGFYRTFEVTALYSVDLADELPVLFRTLRKTIIDYHILICNVFKVPHEGHSVFRPIRHAIFRDLIELRTEDEFGMVECTASELFMKYANDVALPLYKESPLFKLILVGKRKLAAIFEHTIADGVVANYFHEIFLENLAYVDNESNGDQSAFSYGDFFNIESPLDSIIFDYARDKEYLVNPLPPICEDFLENASLDYKYGDPNFHDQITPKGYPEKWPGRFPSTEGDFSLSFKLLNFSPSEVKQLLAKCREKRVTLTTYIEVVHALTLRPIFGNDHYTTHKVAVSLRRFADPDLTKEVYRPFLANKNYKILSTYAVAGPSDNLPPVREFSWDLVQKVNANLVSAVGNRRFLNLMYGFLKDADPLDDNTAFFKGGLGKPKADTVKLSNLGYIKFPELPVGDRIWAVDDIVFAQDVSPTATEFMLNIISCPRGGMNFVLTYFDHRFDDSEVDFSYIMPELRRNIMKYIEVP